MHDVISLLGAERGNIQLLGLNNELVLVVQYGFGLRFLDAFHRESIGSSSVCGRAAASGTLLFVPDVFQDENYAPYVDLAREVGFTSVLSCPLVTPRGDWLGMISAHFTSTAEPSLIELESLQIYGEALAERVDQFLPQSSRLAEVERLGVTVKGSSVLRRLDSATPVTP